jgi:superfamily I DNA/RNA helicase
VLLDEAQDADPVIAAVVLAQSHAQLIAVGDRCQSIYRWRGAIDAMSKFPADIRLPLAQSFRFGHSIAGEANKWLDILQSGLQLRGYERVPSSLGPLAAPGTILCRSNAAAMSEAMDAIEAGRKVALVGGSRDILALAEAAVTLKAGAGCSHPELFAFQTWGQVQDYAENDPGGSDLAVFVKLIDEHGPEVIMDAARGLSDERYASLIISTAHKAKGREWDTVQIAGDFREPKPKKKAEDVVPRPRGSYVRGFGDDDEQELGEIDRDEAMLAYVAVTRARMVLDRAGLAWVDKYL